MKGEEAVQIFDLVIKNRTLPEKIDELVPLSFIGQTAVNFYRQKVSLMDKLGLAEDQKQATLKDGQDAGKMLLAIEARIGELYSQTPEASHRPGRREPGTKAYFCPTGTKSCQHYFRENTGGNMETIKLKETRPLFLTKQGMPRKECLMTIDEICDELGKSISDNPIERHYQLQFARSVLSALKRWFHQHHAFFIAPRIEGQVYYGFTNDDRLVEN